MTAEVTKSQVGRLGAYVRWKYLFVGKQTGTLGPRF
jgi:hypothetical protein